MHDGVTTDNSILATSVCRHMSYVHLEFLALLRLTPGKQGRRSLTHTHTAFVPAAGVHRGRLDPSNYHCVEVSVSPRLVLVLMKTHAQLNCIEKKEEKLTGTSE